MSEQSTASTGYKFNLGGGQATAEPAYLQVIHDTHIKITNLADAVDKVMLVWKLEFLTRRLLATIIEPNERDQMLDALDDIYMLKCAERIPIPAKRYTSNELPNLLNKDDRNDAMIEACMFMVGEFQQYSDKFIGIQTKLCVME